MAITKSKNFGVLKITIFVKSLFKFYIKILWKKKIVVMAPNIKEGGPLTILNNILKKIISYNKKIIL